MGCWRRRTERYQARPTLTQRFGRVAECPCPLPKHWNAENQIAVVDGGWGYTPGSKSLDVNPSHFYARCPLSFRLV